MKEYLLYRKWWFENEAIHLPIPSHYWGETEEEAFKNHINSMTHYELFEHLANFKEKMYGESNE